MAISSSTQKTQRLNERFYLYEHVRNDTGETVYIGKGTKSRHRSVHGRNRHHINLINGPGVTSRIILENLTCEEALRLEVEFIRIARALGYALVNVTDGGEGTTGVVFTEERRAKISGHHHWLFQNGDAIRGSKNPNFKYAVQTPLGYFPDIGTAASVLGIKVTTLRYRCKSKSKRFAEYVAL